MPHVSAKERGISSWVLALVSPLPSHMHIGCHNLRFIGRTYLVRGGGAIKHARSCPSGRSH